MPSDARGCRKLRFLTHDEVLGLIDLAPGSIPPFGRLVGLPAFCDERLGDNEVINLNAGDHTVSVSMRYADYCRPRTPNWGGMPRTRLDRAGQSSPGTTPFVGDQSRIFREPGNNSCPLPRINQTPSGSYT